MIKSVISSPFLYISDQSPQKADTIKVLDPMTSSTKKSGDLGKNQNVSETKSFPNSESAKTGK